MVTMDSYDFPHDVDCPYSALGPCRCGTKTPGEWPSMLERLRMYNAKWRLAFNNGVGIGPEFPPEVLPIIEWAIKRLESSNCISHFEFLHLSRGLPPRHVYRLNTHSNESGSDECRLVGGACALLGAV